MITAEKQRLRAAARDFLQSLTRAEIRAASAGICATLHAWERWPGIRLLCAYAALDSEPDVLTPWPEEKCILLPKVVGTDLALLEVREPDMLKRGAFSILEPGSGCVEHPPKADVILVPGLAFDHRGWRLGRGRGYYDRLLERFEGTRVGVCFDGQVVEAVPTEPHDIPMNFLLTPGGLIACGS